MLTSLRSKWVTRFWKVLLPYSSKIFSYSATPIITLLKLNYIRFICWNFNILEHSTYTLHLGCNKALGGEHTDNASSSCGLIDFLNFLWSWVLGSRNSKCLFNFIQLGYFGPLFTGTMNIFPLSHSTVKSQL